MNIETVKELIQSLESAGELSIREQKFLKLAKEFSICSASLDAAIKTGNMLADQNAQLAAENVEAKKIISECREYFIAGVMNRIRPTNEGYLHMICDTFADETPATDRIMAGIKADGVEEFAAKLRIPGDDQFFDALAKGVALAADDFAKHLREGADK
ncbi:TPA: hypothetical protein ACW7ZE_005959 [Klebsiella pneumoniae]|uniref:hypothetical protein n=1 Tax=Klebsiella pneumoniae TaxID=573 RepID=UPI0027F32AB4|nr:hypothetical protein [Klebsiella pneumoniae]HDT5544693.1 hypothetical protein [Klebsiella pneumoniae subsp. pneumoniae]MCP5843605.1 hypothetical protein [Klebsiella pneumoniae]HDU4564402.1 hypothetical protein [Klebsiella pneumoniae subsp. pneumoniae]HDU5950930.1 hypothetical protein [Klebsiella pneumoniae subsp. pneumoniae]